LALIQSRFERQIAGLRDKSFAEVGVPRDMTLAKEGVLDPAWGGAWEWNLSEGATKTAVVGLLVAAALFAAGAGTGMAAAMIPTVVPFLFDVKRVRLEKTADNFLRIIGARADLHQRVDTPTELYESMPPEMKEQVSVAQFREFLDQAVNAGRANSLGDFFEILPNGECASRVAIR
jgi:hypothetical protein